MPTTADSVAVADTLGTVDMPAVGQGGYSPASFALSLFSAAAEKEDLRLVPYSVIYRMSYILLIDICKVLATMEELAGVRMGWGKLERLGRLST